MKKIYNILMLLAIALTGLSLTACSEDDLDTNQYGKGVSLSAYGPQPVMRGGTLRFLGSNLDQIAQVVIPGCDPITNFEVVKAGSPSEIRVVLPKDGPEPGVVTLITKTDEKITTTTPLSYEEPIVIESISPMTVMPGEEITITGDYLNLVQMIQFANDDENVYVGQNDFVEHTRYKIVVVVPETARTGKLNLYTLDLTDESNDPNAMTYNIMATEENLTVGTPTITKLASPRGEAAPQGTIITKLGETITITGKYFNLVDAVTFGDKGEDGKGTVVEVALKDLTVSKDGTTITLTLPAEAPDGSINLIARSGVSVPVGQLETVAPSECKAAPSPVKAGAALTITGKDLDVVSSVEMPNVTDAIEFTCNKEGTQLVITAVPELAQEGNLTLRMANGKGVDVPFTLVKPVVTGYNNASVSAGGALEIKGTNLDLVKSVDFGGAVVESDAFTSQTETSITLTVPMEAKSGAPTINVKNGTKVEAPELTISEAVFCYATVLPSDDDAIKAGTSATLTVKNMDKLTGVEIDGETCQFVKSGEETLIIGVPESAGNGSKLRLISSNGEVTYTVNFVPATQVSKTVWSGLTQLSWGEGGRVIIPASSLEGVPAGAILTLCYSQVDQQWDQAQINFGDWSGCDWTIQAHDGETLSKTSFTQTLVPTDVYGWFSDGILNRETQLVLTQDILDAVQAKKGECDNVAEAGIIIQGSGLTFSKVTLSYTRDLSETIWTGDWTCSGWGGNQDLAWGGYDWSTFKAGKSIVFTFASVDPTSGWGCISPRMGQNWGNLSTGQFDFTPSTEIQTITFTPTADDIAHLQNDGGLVITGDGYILKKVTIE